MVLDCGWGRVLMAQTFVDGDDIARELEAERPGRRDIAVYAADPHVIVGAAPQTVFLDPSHTYRLWLSVYRAKRAWRRGFVVRRLRTRGDATAITDVCAACQMVTVDPDCNCRNRTSRKLTYVVAEDATTGAVIGAVTGIDHVEAFDDVEQGSSLWCLAVHPQAPHPGVGEALTRYLAEHYAARGRAFMDLSVMHDNAEAIALAAVASLLAAVKAVVDAGVELPIECHPLFTITEEVGSGSSAALHGDISEMVSHDIAISAPGQNTSEHCVSIAIQDSSGPFDWHLTHKLLDICAEHGIPHRRDVYRYYRSDSASAVEAGNDIRTALVGFGADASHGQERAHMDGICAMAELTALYVQSEPVSRRDVVPLGPIDGFTRQLTPHDMRGAQGQHIPAPEEFLEDTDEQ